MSIAINAKQCVGCGKCSMVCPGSLIHMNADGKAFIKYPKDCWGCTSCLKECAVHAIRFYLGADMGGMGSLVHTEKEGDVLRWIIDHPDGKTSEIRIHTKQSNQYCGGNVMHELSHLDELEAEAIYIIREVAAECEKPVMLYSIGKDSSVMLHLAMKAFYPEKPPFPFLHIDTTWKFKDMIRFRDETAKKLGIEMLVYTNEEGVKQGINPFDHGAAYTDIMKTQALKQALTKYGFTAAFGGGRRDEEKSRAKERIFSFRNEAQAWDPKNQRPEMWKLYNTKIKKGESMRVFPISNWTEKDIWQYIKRENIDIVPLYFAAERPVVYRDGNIIMVDDDRLPLKPGEKPEYKSIRFRTLGCYPLTGGIESTATTLDEIIDETLSSVSSERTSRVIDNEAAGSMERRKREGYF